MKPEHTYLDRLNAKSKAYRVKVKVIDKGRPQISPEKKVLYQSITLADNRGNTIKGALFGDQIEAYKTALQYDCDYEIANAPIQPAPDASKYKGEYQITFGGSTIIQPLGVEDGPKLPKFHTIASIPRSASSNERFAVLGIVLYVEPAARTIIGSEGRQYSVCEIVLTDHSTEQPIIVSAWNDLTKECNVLRSWVESNLVVGIIALKPSTHKGFSLSSTMSTVIDQAPPGEGAVALRAWAQENEELLSERRARVEAIRQPNEKRSVTTIEDLHGKTDKNTMQEERHWLAITIPEATFSSVITYLGCSKCGKGGPKPAIPVGEKYCCISCSSAEAISVPRVTFRFRASDSSGTLPLTAFNDDAEKLLGQPASEIFKLKSSGDAKAFAKILKRLKENEFMVQVGPSTALSRCRVFTWVLKGVAVDEEP